MTIEDVPKEGILAQKVFVFGESFCELRRMAVVITGMGCVTPIGTGVAELSRSLRHGVSGTGPLTRFDPTPYACQVSAEVRDFRPQDFLRLRDIRAFPRIVQFAVAAARMAMEDARLAAWPDPARAGVVLGTSTGLTEYHVEQWMIFLERGMRRVQPTFPAYAHNGALASECAIQLQAHGPVFNVSGACTSGTDALGLGHMIISSGMADVMLVGASEAPLSPLLFATFDRLGTLSHSFNDRPESAARPFSADRDGFVLGEGAAVFVLEDAERAQQRGARILAEVAGYAATCDAADHFSKGESGEDAARAIETAFSMAGLSPEDVDYVHAHGSGTRQSDPFETTLLRRVLGAHAGRAPVSATKSTMGHLLGASCSAELAATLVGMQEGFLPPTMHLEHPDPMCDLDYVPNQAREAQIDVALLISFGLGSVNSALVVRKHDPVARG